MFTLAVESILGESDVDLGVSGLVFELMLSYATVVVSASLCNKSATVVRVIGAMVALAGPAYSFVHCGF